MNVLSEIIKLDTDTKNSEKVVNTSDGEWQAELHPEDTENWVKLSADARVFYTVYCKPYFEKGNKIYPLMFQTRVAYLGQLKHVFYIERNLYAFMDEDALKRWMERVSDEGYEVYLILLDVNEFFKTHLIDLTLELLGVPDKTDVDIQCFYSPTDLRLAFSDDIFLSLVQNGIIVQKRNLKIDTKKNGKSYITSPRGYKLTIHDAKGWTPSGLADLCNSVGVNMRAKKALDDVKGIMIEAFISRTETAMDYSLGDVEDLNAAITSFEHLVRNDIVKLLEVDAPNKLPKTTGALVASFLSEWVRSSHSDREVFEFCLRKQGIINEDGDKKTVQRDRAVFNKTVENIKSVGDIKNKDGVLFKRGYTHPKTGKWVTTSKSRYEQFMEMKLQYDGVSSCRVQYFAHKQSNNSSGFNAIVQGGRCNNERPTEYRLLDVADIDLKSCYGSALLGFIYPVGLPTVLACNANDKRPTLGEVLKETEDERVDGLWQVIVNTKENLSFEIDLVPSKTTTLPQIRRAYNDNFSDIEYIDGGSTTNLDSSIEQWWLKENASNIPGEFCLVRRQIVNGIITSEILKVLKAVATDNEYSELMEKLEVETMVLYKASDKVETLDEWCDIVIKDGSTKDRKARIREADKLTDGRTKAWYPLPLEGFIGKLIGRRGEIKKLAKNAVGDEKSRLKAEDSMLKLFINTTYGVLASPYFDIGNVVVANNITAKARVGVWMFNKALHTRQSITDGGMYSPVCVPYLDNTVNQFQRPGFGKLAENVQWGLTRNDRYRGQKTTAIGGLDWNAKFKEAEATINLVKSSGSKDADQTVNDIINDLGRVLDELALKHINEFWSNYRVDDKDPKTALSLPFDIEHKGENCGTVAGYWNKAHYCIKRLDGSLVYKIRGARKYKEAWLKSHPCYEILTNIVNDADYFPSDMEYSEKYLLKVGQWKQVQSSNEGSYTHLKGLYPGDEVTIPRNYTVTNSHMHYDTLEGRNVVTSRKRFRTVNRVKTPVVGFEKYGDKGISAVHKAMVSDNETYGKR